MRALDTFNDFFRPIISICDDIFKIIEEKYEPSNSENQIILNYFIAFNIIANSLNNFLTVLGLLRCEH